MAEEATDINTKTDEVSAATAAESVSVSDEAASARGTRQDPKKTITKAAETKLKEMSRRAKERGKNDTPKARSEPIIKLNQNWFLGGLGLSAIIAIGYFIYKSRGSVSEPPPELQPFYHLPKEQEDSKEKKETNSFDLNSF